MSAKTSGGYRRLRQTAKAISMILLLLAISARLAACTHVASNAANHDSRHAWTVPGTLRIGTAVAPNSLNPILQTIQAEGMLNGLIYDQLVVIDPAGNPRPGLATVVPNRQNGGISRDGRTVTYKLRRDVRWQDGVRFTSHDVQFSYNAVMNGNNNVSSRVGFELIDRVQTPDDYTIVFHLKEPFAPFVTTIFSAGDAPQEVIPEHLLARYHDLNRVAFNAAPVGTGPFRVVRWLRGDRIILEANRRYFLGEPKLHTIEIHLVPDENTEVNQMRTHELDWLFNASENSYATLKNLPEVRNVAARTNAYRGLLINTERPLVRDMRVRQAIAFAIDKRALTQKVTYGSALPATEDIPSFMWAYNPDVKTYVYNPNMARQLLSQAGWTPGPDGVLQKKGLRMHLLLTMRQGAAADASMAVQIQAWLRAIGIEAVIKTYPGQMLFASTAEGGILNTGRYDINLSGFFSGADPDNSAQFRCSARPPNGFNWSRYCTAEMDAAQDRAVGSLDQATRKRAYAVIENLLARDVPQIFIYWSRSTHAINPDFKNFAPGPGGVGWQAYKWSI